MKPPYHAFMLRIWPTDEQHSQWRASLEDPHTHHIQNFNTLEDLCTYLQQKRFQEKTPQKPFNRQVP